MLNTAVDIDYSDDSDEDMDPVGTVRSKMDEDQRRKDDEEEKRLIEQINKMSVRIWYF